MAKKTGFMSWIDHQLQADPQLARDVDELINAMKIEQELVSLREKRGLSQRDLADRLGTTQPYVAKLESGRIKNLGLKTLVKCATALDADLMVRLVPRRAAVVPTRAAQKTTKAAAPRRALRRVS
jgi:predicted XRE-type DNA-binding protein